MNAARLSVSLVCFAFLLLFSSVTALADVSANPKSMIFHNASCQYYGCKSCTVTFKTGDEARKVGYRACKKCGG